MQAAENSDLDGVDFVEKQKKYFGGPSPVLVN